MYGERREPPTAPGYNSGFRDALVEMNIPVVSCGHDHANDYCLLSDGKSKSLQNQDLPEKRDDTLESEISATSEKNEEEAPKQPHSLTTSKNDKIWLCYGGGVGFGGYGGYNGYIRRVRLFELDANEAKIRTWKRVEYGDVSKRVDEQVIVDAGRVVAG